MRETRGARIPRGAIVLLLSAIYAVNYIDRQILAIILEHIKHEFGVSDTLLGLLVGPAFALFYATLGMPIALAADRMSRSRIIAASLACFSVMTLACGLAARFWQLVVARMLTGVGEAGTYPPAERATAQAIYATGVNVGLMIAFFAGGWIADNYGWRAAFIAAGVPGLVLTLLVVLILRDPPRAVVARTGAEARLGFLWRQRSYRYIVLGTAMSAFSGYGITAFVPAFLIRSHGMGSTEVGLIFALIVGLGGGLGTYATGRIADLAARRGGIQRNLLVPAVAAIIATPFWVPFFLSGKVAVAIAAAVIPVSLSASFIGPCVATIQTITPPAMRARAAAIQLFVGNLIGLGLGPLVIGVLSDLLRPLLGADSLRYAMFAGVAAAFASIPFYLIAARHVPEDLARLDA